MERVSLLFSDDRAPMIQQTLTICTCVMLAAATVSARDIYVDNVGGNDLHLGVAPVASNVGGGPVRTIDRALRLAKSGDRIVLADSGEPYRTGITLQGARHSGSARRPFILVGGGATLDGSVPVHPEAWEHVEGDTFRFKPQRSSHHQLFLNNRPLTRVPVDNNVLSLPKLKTMQWCLFERHVYVNLAPPSPKDPAGSEFIPEDILEQAATRGWRYVPQQYDFSHTHHTVGITLFDVRNVIISDLTVQGFQLDGINAHDKAFNAQIIGVVSRGNGRSGMTIAGSSRVRVSESLLGNNGESQVRVEGFSVAEIERSEILAFTAPSVLRDGGEVSIDGLPLRGNILEGHVDPPPVPAGADAPMP